MKKTDLAYIAGLLDGEAYIGIKKIKTRYNGRVNPAYHERIQVRMVDEPAIEFLAGTLGGSYYQEKPSAEKGRPLFCFAASDRLAVNIINQVMAYLRVKRNVAQTVLELRKLKENPDKIAVPVEMKNRWGEMKIFKRWRHSPDHVAACESLYLECKRLNKVGI